MRTRPGIYCVLLIVATGMLSGCLWRDDGYRGDVYRGDRNGGGSVNWEGGSVNWEGRGDKQRKDGAGEHKEYRDGEHKEYRDGEHKEYRDGERKEGGADQEEGERR